jgi:hypothetical protein
MPERTFTAPDGTRWQAWDVVPSQHADWSEKALRHLPDVLADGWLVFESAMEKRRMHPIPPGWETEGELRLREYCVRAEPVTRRAVRP